jgi:hypothetical protein
MDDDGLRLLAADIQKMFDSLPERSDPLPTAHLCSPAIFGAIANELKVAPLESGIIDVPGRRYIRFEGADAFPDLPGEPARTEVI